MAYNRHEWATGEAITEQRMNNIELGIAELESTIGIDANHGIQKTIGDIQGSISGISEDHNWIISATTGHSPMYSSLNNRFEINEDAINTINTNLSGQINGINNTISKATTTNASEHHYERTYADLNERFNEDEEQI